MVEPGRAIAGPGTVTVYEVGTIKDVALDGGLIRRYVSVDGGMSDNIRTALYDADYTVTLASRSSDAHAVLCRVVGKHCESGDIVVRDCYLPADLAIGDLLAVAATGAYCYAMASNYNRVPRPAVVAVRRCDAQAAAAPRDRRRPDASGDPVTTADTNPENRDAAAEAAVPGARGGAARPGRRADRGHAAQAGLPALADGDHRRRSRSSWSIALLIYAFKVFRDVTKPGGSR